MDLEKKFGANETCTIMEQTLFKMEDNSNGDDVDLFKTKEKCHVTVAKRIDREQLCDKSSVCRVVIVVSFVLKIMS